MKYYLEHDGIVHLPHPNMDTTLCGDAIEGNPMGGMGDKTRFEPGSNPCRDVITQPVTCKMCLAMASLCRRIPKAHLTGKTP